VKQENSMKKLILAGLIVALGLVPSSGFAQTSGGQAPEGAPEKILVGEVQSVDVSGTEITLTDGTKLLTPPGSMLRPGALEEGMVVVAVYKEQENGDKVLTRLSLRQSEPAPAKPGDPPKKD
jgi:hypothetical protein